jgi:hypothetical protein
MPLVAGLNRYISLILTPFSYLRVWKIWQILGLYFLIVMGVLLAHLYFDAPFIYGIMSMWTGLFGNEQSIGFSHYPGHYILLPYFFGWARFYVGLVVEGLVFGGLAVLFYDRMTSARSEERTQVRSMFSNWISLSMGWLLIYGLWLLFSLVLPELFDSWLRYSPRRQAAFEFGFLPLMFVIVMSLMYFVLPAIAIYRESVWAATKRSVRLFIRMPFTFFFLSFTIALVPLMISILQGKAGTIVQKFSPELVVWITVAGVVADLAVMFMWVGSAVRMLVEEEG